MPELELGENLLSAEEDRRRDGNLSISASDDLDFPVGFLLQGQGQSFS